MVFHVQGKVHMASDLTGPLFGMLLLVQRWPPSPLAATVNQPRQPAVAESRQRPQTGAAEAQSSDSKQNRDLGRKGAKVRSLIADRWLINTAQCQVVVVLAFQAGG